MMQICKFLLVVVLLYASSNAYGDNKKSPVVLKADIVQFDANFKGISAKGNIHATMDSYSLRADKLYYDIEKDVLFAEGNVRVKDKEGKIILGQRAILKDKLKKGIIDEFILMLPDGSILVAAYVQRLDEKRAKLYNASFTPCKIVCGREPIWQVKAKETNINYTSERIEYKNMFFEIYGVPVMIFPYFSHPTPTAPAQSGILVPHIKNNSLLIPIYFRAKSDLDFTISPRVAARYTIFEGQLRHLLNNGYYEINGSTGNPAYDKGSKNSHPTRYHIFAKGSFYKDNLNYGFDINRTSDKAYLTNYFTIYDSYLETKLYATKADKSDYSSLEAYSYQGLRVQDTKNNTPFIFPRVRNQKIINLNDNETILFKIKNDALSYNENYNKQLIRNALELSLNTNIITNGGHLFNFALYNRNDIYLLSNFDSISDIKKESVLTRNIPEIQAKWQYPLIKNFSHLSMKLEPMIATFIGINYDKKLDKFAQIDVAKYELSEHNLFSANRYSGIDYHDYGRRLSYGLDTSLFKDNYYFDFFLGQLVYQNNISSKGSSEYVGNTSFTVADDFKLYYRFRTNKKFKSIRDDVGLSAKYKKLSTNLEFSRLSNISKYYVDDKLDVSKNKISQVNAVIQYNIFDSLVISTGARLDITKKTQLLQRSILMTYAMDCVSITAKFYDDFTHDSVRGIRKNTSKTIAVGLKVLNM